MIEHLINYAASLFNLPEWGGLEVNGFAILMLVLFGLVIVSEILIAIHDRPQAKHTGIVDWGLAKFFHLHQPLKFNHHK